MWFRSLYFWNEIWHFENFFLRKDILKVLLTRQHPTYGFLVQTPAQLRFGRERLMVLLETKKKKKKSLNRDTVIARVGT